MQLRIPIHSPKVLPVSEDLGVQRVREHILLCNRWAILLLQLFRRTREIKVLHVRTWASLIERPSILQWSSLDDIRAQRLWETAWWLVDCALEVRDDRVRQS